MSPDPVEQADPAAGSVQRGTDRQVLAVPSCYFGGNKAFTVGSRVSGYWGGTERSTHWLLSLRQLVYPHDFRLTEKEVRTLLYPHPGFKGSEQRRWRFSHPLVLFVAENQYLLLVLPRLLLR